MSHLTLSGMPRLAWWKWLTIALLYYTVIAGFLAPVPRLPILNETIRNQHFHVTMWFAMMGMMLVSVVYSVRYLRKPNSKLDFIAVESGAMGTLFGLLGLVTGAIWANFTWGDFWNGDPKQNYAAIALLIYLAYFVLRGSITDETQRARLSAVYNIFAFSALIPLLYILPRMVDSLHPNSGGNKGFVVYDLDGNLRMVFYPAVIAWSLLGWWIVTLRVSLRQKWESLLAA